MPVLARSLTHVHTCPSLCAGNTAAPKLINRSSTSGKQSILASISARAFRGSISNSRLGQFAGLKIPRFGAEVVQIEPLDKSRPVQEQILHQLKHLPIFEDLLDIETLVKMGEKCRMRSFEAGEHIVNEGDDGDSMYIIKFGRISVSQSCTTDMVMQTQGPSHIELAQVREARVKRGGGERERERGREKGREGGRERLRAGLRLSTCESLVAMTRICTCSWVRCTFSARCHC